MQTSLRFSTVFPGFPRTARRLERAAVSSRAPSFARTTSSARASKKIFARREIFLVFSAPKPRETRAARHESRASRRADVRSEAGSDRIIIRNPARNRSPRARPRDARARALDASLRPRRERPRAESASSWRQEVERGSRPGSVPSLGLDLTRGRATPSRRCTRCPSRVARELARPALVWHNH